MSESIDVSALKKQINDCDYREGYAKFLLEQLGLFKDTQCDIEERIKKMFEDSEDTKCFKYSLANDLLCQGYCLARRGWNGKNMFVCKQIEATIPGEKIADLQSLPMTAKVLLKANNVKSLTYKNQMLIIKPNGVASSWVPSSEDLAADDWMIVESPKDIVDVKLTFPIIRELKEIQTNITIEHNN